MKNIAIFVLIVFLISGYAHAANVALVVKDANTLSTDHEKDVKNALLELGHTITFVDKNSVVDYSTFDLIVIAGRPKDSTETLDSFVANIPVNTKPTVAVDGKFPANWGWASGVSSIHSSNAQAVYIFNPSHPITSGLSGTVTVHATTGKSLSAISSGLSFVATSSGTGSKGVVAYANAKTQLLNGQKTKNRVVFFGITSPLYWTAGAEKLFKQSVTWALGDTDGDGVANENDLCPNTPPELTADSTGCVNMPPTMSFVSPVEGASINEGTKMAINVNANDPENATITYTVKVDGNVVANSIPAEYTWSFNSAGAHVVTVTGSDSVNTVEKSVNVSVVDTDFVQGFKSFTPETATIEEGDSLPIAVEAHDDNLLNIKLYKDGNLVKDFNGYLLAYAWVPGFDEAGAHTFTFNATGDDVSFTGTRTYTVTDVASVARDVDADGVLEYAADKDHSISNTGYEYFFDPNGNSVAVVVVGSDDGKADFVINGNRYWDPVGNIFTTALNENVDNAAGDEAVFDVTGDGIADKIFFNNALVNYPDVTADISFSNSAPNSGETVQISAVVKNTGGFGANDFVVEIYVDNVLKDTKTVSVGAGATKTLIINYTVTKTHEIKVKVDVTNKIKESSESNEFTKSLSLYSPPPPPPQPPSGGGGSGITRSALCTILDPEITVDEGSAYALSFNVKNTGNIFLTNVHLNVNGFPSAWLNVGPASDTILVDRTTTFSLVFDARNDGVYDVSIDVLSDSLSLCKRSFKLKVNAAAQPQPIVEIKTYANFEIVDFQISQQDNSLLLTVKLKNTGSDGSAAVGLNVPDGWAAPEEQSVEAKASEEKTVTFTLQIPENAQGNAAVSAYANYDSASGATTSEKEQLLTIQQSSPLTGLFAGGSTLIFFALASATFLLLALNKYVSAKRPPWHSSISKYSFHNGWRLNPLLLLLLAIPAYVLHPFAGITVAGAVFAMYAAVRFKTSKFKLPKMKKLYDFKKSKR